MQIVIEQTPTGDWVWYVYVETATTRKRIALGVSSTYEGACNAAGKIRR